MKIMTPVLLAIALLQLVACGPSRSHDGQIRARGAVASVDNDWCFSRPPEGLTRARIKNRSNNSYEATYDAVLLSGKTDLKPVAYHEKYGPFPTQLIASKDLNGIDGFKVEAFDSHSSDWSAMQSLPAPLRPNSIPNKQILIQSSLSESPTVGYPCSAFPNQVTAISAIDNDGELNAIDDIHFVMPGQSYIVPENLTWPMREINYQDQSAEIQSTVWCGVIQTHSDFSIYQTKLRLEILRIASNGTIDIRKGHLDLNNNQSQIETEVSLLPRNSALSADGLLKDPTPNRVWEKIEFHADDSGLSRMEIRLSGEMRPEAQFFPCERFHTEQGYKFGDYVWDTHLQNPFASN